ncbi:hypothetical protein [Sinobaca sp. H24]|uniref:hypothetical protein n=1 Tax=Sinobaca sp. H24 TaxID=2923376 RepID=UPI0035B483A4
MNSLYYAIKGTERQPDIDIKAVEELNEYWDYTRKYYQGFESGMNAPHTRCMSTKCRGPVQQSAAAGESGRAWGTLE